MAPEGDHIYAQNALWNNESPCSKEHISASPNFSFQKDRSAQESKEWCIEELCPFIAVFQFHTVDTIVAIHFNICKQFGELFHPICFFPHAISSLASLLNINKWALFGHPTSQLAGCSCRRGIP